MIHHANVHVVRQGGMKFFEITHPYVQGAIVVYTWSAAQRRARTLAAAQYYQRHYH